MKSYPKILNILSREIASINNLRITWAEVVWVLFLLVIFIIFFLVSDSAWIFNVLIIPAILIGYYKNNQLTQLQQKLLTGLTIAVIFTCVIKIVLIVYRNTVLPPEYDFRLYWIYGQAGSRLMNPYEPGVLLQFARSFNPSEGYINELYFFQFPPLIFLFLPLGWFGINTAAALWYIFLFIVMILDINLLWSIFFKGIDYKHLLLAASLTLVLGPIFENFKAAQINLIVLLAFLLYWRKHNSIAGGIWLGIGMIVKPILVIVLIHPVLTRHWRSILGVIIAIIVSSTITILTFGPDMFFGYFTNNPIVLKMPNYLYIEGNNQSLLATILRLTNFDFSNGSPYLQPIYIGTALVLTGVTSFLIFLIKDGDELYSDYALALTIIFALLLFPKTLTHYAILLIIPVLMILAHLKEIGVNPWFVIIFITSEYVLVSLEGSFIFISILLAWLVISGICINLLRSRLHKQALS